ncbi:LL-diaminopimelate aminotransferase [Evansella sp. LMS18]|uniref:LL-diaminopimelate aminotransferase n=1 Tax=Evansella sp. LMS18 TaxID=2924033 RepID=UPI0020D05789|nr:LL-diaminopimelate aminotransferase [Evansella sp. LMS18]UTR11074.1 LL-diaminopimelate aminotransferase [Evansella sp. LMS18]
MEILLSQKMDKFGTSIFSELSNYKKQKLEAGEEIIDLSIGSPDLPPPSFVMEELARQVKDPSNYGYSLTGTFELHKAVEDYYFEGNGVSLDAQKEIIVTMGSQDGLVHFPMAVADPGDVVLVPDPGYTAYEAGISLAGAQPYFMPLKEENNFLPDLDSIPEDILQKAKLMILNFPGNPVPALASVQFFEKAIAIAEKFNIIILHDFAYSELYYDEKPVSFLSVNGAKEVGVEFNSFSKSFNMAGCRIGYAAGNPSIIEALGRLKSNLDYGVFTPVQKAAALAMRNAASFSSSLRTIYSQRRDVLVKGLQEAGWHVEPPEASMFIWAKVPENETSTSFTYKLLDETGIVVVPGNAFGETGEGYVRIALVQEEEVLKKAAEKLKKSDMFIHV